MAWMICTIALAILFFVVALRTRPSLAMGAVIPLSFALPAWLQWPLFAMPDDTVVGAGLDVKVALSSVALICYSFLPRATFPVKLIATDWAMIALLVVHATSDLFHSGPSWSILLRMYAEWYVPYICGRLAFQYRSDLRSIWPVIGGTAIFLAVLAIFEAVSRINLFELAFGLRPEEQTPREAFRWGLRRAYGPCLNPIYFGLLQMLLTGWCFQAAHRAYLHQAHKLWLLAPLLSMAGVISTGSRGPILGLILFVLALVFVRARRNRIPLMVLAVVLIGVGVYQKERVVSVLERWSGESEAIYRNKNVVVNGDEVMQFSGTRSRLIMLEMYRVALMRSGLIGYGTEAVTGFPIHVPIAPQEADTLRRIRYIDNEYVLLTLRFGFAGLICFLTASIVSVWTLVRLHDQYLGENLSMLVAYVAAGLMAVLVMIFTVWMPHDYGYALLWTLGAASGLNVADHYGFLTDRRRQPKSDELDEEEHDESDEFDEEE